MSQAQPEISSLWDLIMSLLRNPEERAAFEADPEGFLEARGFEDLTAEDVADLVPMLSENPEVQPVEEPVFRGQPVEADPGTPGFGAEPDGRTFIDDPPQDPSSPPFGSSPAGSPEAAAGGSPLESAVQQIQLITQRFEIDNSLNLDQSKTVIFDQSQTAQAFGEGSVAGTGDISGVATGDGSLAAGDELDIQGQVATTGGTAAGEGANVFQDSPGAQAIEDSNVLQGQDNVGGFGDGAVSNAEATGGGTATSANLGDVTVGDGSGLAVGGDASGNFENTQVDIAAEDNAQVNVAADDSQADQIDDIDASNETVTDIDVSEQVDASQRLQQDIDSEGDTTVLG